MEGGLCGSILHPVRQLTLLGGVITLNSELVEYVNDVNREYTEVWMELNINGIMDTAYSYGNERLRAERFDGDGGLYLAVLPV